jgi:hypothetical protein
MNRLAAQEEPHAPISGTAVPIEPESRGTPRFPALRLRRFFGGLVIWCERFGVLISSAALQPGGS